MLGGSMVATDDLFIQCGGFGEALLVCASDTIQVNWRMVGKNFTWDLDGLFEHSDEQSLEDKIWGFHENNLTLFSL